MIRLNLMMKKNQAPGTAVYTGSHMLETTVKHIFYNKDELLETSDMEQKVGYNHWLIFKGMSNSQKIKSICESYGVDSLVTEDILNVHQRNKIEYFEKYVFAVMQYAYLQNSIVSHDYLSILLFEDKVLTFHEHNLNIFDDVNKRLSDNSGPIRKLGHDYLFYAIFDAIIDNDLIVEKEISSRTLKLEEDILTLESTDQSMLYNSRKELLYLKKTIEPLYDSLMRMEYIPSPIIKDDLNKYYMDLTDHIHRILDEINSERELLRNLLDVHMNNVSNKMNAIMKTLTIFSAIFIPLSFLAGVFGMNFLVFPILANPIGIYIFMGICASIAIGMIFFFRSRKWF